MEIMVQMERDRQVALEKELELNQAHYQNQNAELDEVLAQKEQ